MKFGLKLIIVIGIVLIVYNNWFLNFDPNIGFDLSYDFAPIYEGIPLPWIWKDTIVGHGLGSFALNTLWSYPVQFFYQVFLLLKIPFWFQMKYLAILPFVIFSVFGINKLAKIYEFDWLPASILYLINTYILLLIDGGQLNLALAYSLFPLTFYFFVKALDKSWKDIFRFVMVFFFVTSFDMRVLVVFGVCALVHLLFNLKKIKDYLFVGMVGMVLMVLLNFYWILPSLLARQVALPTGYDSEGQIRTLSFASLQHALFLVQPHWWANVFGKITEPMWYFALIPIGAFSNLVFFKNKSKVLFFAAVSIVGIFLAKGTQPPFGEINVWLFNTIPGMNLFRDPTKFYFLIAFGYSVLIGFIFESLKKYLKPPFLYLTLFIYTLVLTYPVYSGGMTGTFSPSPFAGQLNNVSNSLQKDNDFSRVLWIPTKSGMGFYSYLHPAIDAYTLLSKRPFTIGTVGTYEVFNFLREAPFMGELFDVAAIKYIVYPFPDARRDELKQDNIEYYDVFSNQIENLDWIEDKVSGFPLTVFKTRKSQGHVFLAPKAILVVGSDSIYNELVKIPNFQLSKNPIVFLEEKPGMGELIQEYPDDSLVLYEKWNQDLAATFIERDNFVFPAENLGPDPDISGWWKREGADLIWWRSFLHEKYGIDNLDFDYGGGLAVAEGNLRLEVRSEKFKKGTILLARVMQSTRGGKVEFYQDGEKVGSEIPTQELESRNYKLPKVQIKLSGYRNTPDQVFEYDKASFHWHEVGELGSDGKIEIRVEGDINVVNSLAVTTESEWENLSRKADEITLGGQKYWYGGDPTVDYPKLNLGKDNIGGLSFERINPSHYKVKIEGLKELSTIAFSEAYDPFWKIKPVGGNGDVQSSFPLYSLINGFVVEKDGEYDVYFEPQKYVNWGLGISVAVFVLLGFYLANVKLQRKHGDISQKQSTTRA